MARKIKRTDDLDTQYKSVKTQETNKSDILKAELYNAHMSGDKDKEVDIIYRRQRQLAQRHYRLKQKGLEKASYSYRAEHKRGMVTSKHILKNMNDKELYELGMETIDKLSYAQSTIKGTRTMIDLRIQRLSNALLLRGINLTEQELEDFFKNDGGELLKVKQFDSNQVLEDYSDFGDTMSIEDFVDQYVDYENRTNKDEVSYVKKIQEAERRLRKIAKL